MNMMVYFHHTRFQQRTWLETITSTTASFVSGSAMKKTKATAAATVTTKVTV